MTITNHDSTVINKLEASLTDDARVVIYNCHMFIVQATRFNPTKNLFSHKQCSPIVKHTWFIILRASMRILMLVPEERIWWKGYIHTAVFCMHKSRKNGIYHPAQEFKVQEAFYGTTTFSLMTFMVNYKKLLKNCEFDVQGTL